MKITKRLVDGLGEESLGKVIRDDELKGFGVRKNQDGTITYLVEYRAGRGRGFPVRRISLGRHGVLTADQARSQARDTLVDVLKGGDPAAQRRSRALEITVGELLEIAIESHWKAHQRKSAGAFEQMIRHTLIPRFGKTKLSDLTRIDVRTWHASQTHRQRQANLDLALLHKALNIAVSDGQIPSNPASGIVKFIEKKRVRRLNDRDLKALWSAFDDPAISSETRLLFKLLALTGCRKGEWLDAQWDDVDFEQRILRLRDAKAGARDVPLSSFTTKLLSTAPKTTPWVIPSSNSVSALSPSRVHGYWKKVLAIAGLTDFHVHDLRHAYASRGAHLGASALILRDALGHRTLAMTSRYVAEQTHAVFQLSEAIGADLEKVVGLE